MTRLRSPPHNRRRTRAASSGDGGESRDSVQGERLAVQAQFLKSPRRGAMPPKEQRLPDLVPPNILGCCFQTFESPNGGVDQRGTGTDSEKCDFLQGS